MFCGLIPGPFQMLGAAICAVIFRINLPLALVTTFYTNPFTIVPLYILAFALGQGAFTLFGHPHRAFIAPPDYGDPGCETLFGWSAAFVNWMVQLGAPLALGLVLLASMLAVIGYFGARIAWRVWLVRAWRLRGIRRNQAPITKQ